MLRNEKGFSVAEIITVMAVMGIISVFIFQLYLFINKRYLEWDRDNTASQICLQATNSISTQLEKTSKVIDVDEEAVELEDFNGKRVRIYSLDSTVFINSRRILSNEAILRKLKFEYSEGRLEQMKFELDFSYGNRVYSLSGGSILPGRGCANLRGAL